MRRPKLPVALLQKATHDRWQICRLKSWCNFFCAHSIQCFCADRCAKPSRHKSMLLVLVGRGISSGIRRCTPSIPCDKLILPCVRLILFCGVLSAHRCMPGPWIPSYWRIALHLPMVSNPDCYKQRLLQLSCDKVSIVLRAFILPNLRDSARLNQDLPATHFDGLSCSEPRRFLTYCFWLKEAQNCKPHVPGFWTCKNSLANLPTCVRRKAHHVKQPIIVATTKCKK